MKHRRLVIVSIVLAVLCFLAYRDLRLWRDTIFYSQDLSAFVLPNGIEVPTNRWLSESELLTGHRRFAYVMTADDEGHFSSPFHLSFFDSQHDGYAQTVEAEGPITEILVASYTVSVDGYTKHTVTRGDIE
jgi:hypothetical protein